MTPEELKIKELTEKVEKLEKEKLEAEREKRIKEHYDNQKGGIPYPHF
jgi:uncharacterized protein (UPF0335 family)